MKKFLLFTLLLLAQVGSVHAQLLPGCCFELPSFDVEARVAYFIPQDKRIRDVYGKHGWAEYEIEASTPFQFNNECFCLENVDLWTNVSYYQKKGHSTCLRDRTKVTNWAINFGGRYFFDTCWSFRPYVGFGIGAAHVRFHDHSPYVSNRIKKWGFAILAKSGIRYDVTCNLFLDLFADYAYHWFDFHHKSGVSTHNVDTGGLKLGLGLGYHF